MLKVFFMVLLLSMNSFASGKKDFKVQKKFGALDIEVSEQVDAKNLVDILLTVKQGDKVIGKKQYTKTESLGGFAGLRVPPEQIVEDYFILEKSGDYNSRLLLIHSSGAIVEFPSGSYFWDKEKGIFIILAYSEVDETAEQIVYDLKRKTVLWKFNETFDHKMGLIPIFANTWDYLLKRRGEDYYAYDSKKKGTWVLFDMKKKESLKSEALADQKDLIDIPMLQKTTGLWKNLREN
jgi:hypothetical protein